MTPYLEYPGHRVDRDMVFTPYNTWAVIVKEGKIYSHFSPLFPWLSSFFYTMYGSSGLYIIPALSGFLSMIIMYHFACRFLNDKQSLFCSIMLGLGTPIFFYSLSFWEHSFAFLIVMIILLISLKVIEGKSILLILFAPLIILCLLIRSESIVFVFSLLLAGIIAFWKDLPKYRNLLFSTCIIVVIFGGAFVVFNLKDSGTLLGVHITKHLPHGYDQLYYWIHKTLIPGYFRIKIIFSLLFRTGIGQGIQGTAILTMLALSIIFLAVAFMRKNERFVKNKIVHLAIYLSLAILTFAAVINIFSHSTPIGLFQVTPFVVFSFFIFLENSNDRLLRYLKFLTIIYFIIILFLPYHGQTQWGPRYILYIYPLLIILSWKAIPIIKKKFNIPNGIFLQGLFFILLFLSFIIQINGVLRLYNNKKHQTDIEAIMTTEPTGVIISEFENTLPMYYPRNYSEKLFFCANNGNISELIKRLYQKDINRFSVTSFKSYGNGKKIDTSILTNIKLPDSKNVYLVRNMYRDPKNKKKLVLSVFEIR
ncbi:MAG: ArnT family glycosyltransferase [Planctomycetota bacterium]